MLKIRSMILRRKDRQMHGTLVRRAISQPRPQWTRLPDDTIKPMHLDLKPKFDKRSIRSRFLRWKRYNLVYFNYDILVNFGCLSWQVFGFARPWMLPDCSGIAGITSSLLLSALWHLDVFRLKQWRNKLFFFNSFALISFKLSRLTRYCTIVV